MSETITAAPSLDLSLYRLEVELAELVEYRQSRLADTERPTSEDEVAAIDAEIERYRIATPAKVSGVVAIFRSWKEKRETAKAEIRRLQNIVSHLECMEARLKDYCVAVLERLPEPRRGCRNLVGADGSSLSLKGNGGLQPLEITDESAVPLDCKKATVVMPADEWNDLREHMLDMGITLISESVELDRDAIRAAITDTGGIPGARLLDRGQHVEVR